MNMHERGLIQVDNRLSAKCLIQYKQQCIPVIPLIPLGMLKGKASPALGSWVSKTKVTAKRIGNTA
jgi:hypothetical protein